MSRKRVWIVGTVSWDTVVYTNDFPKAGGFAQSTSRVERLGGSAANIAQGLASAGIETGLVTFLGNDDLGQRITTLLQASQIQHLEILKVNDNSSHALVVVDGNGDRTVFALSNNYLSRLSIADIGLQKSDIVVFALWRPVFMENLKYAQALGCYTVVGLEALNDPQAPKANLALGSISELASDNDISHYLDRFDRIVVTSGANGADLYSASHHLHQPALSAEVVDTTGAGDSFFAGFLAALARGDVIGNIGMKAGALWSADMVSQYRSIPPLGKDVVGLLHVLDSAEQE
ncbi:MAG: PfkB family carbohydrate kinase [Actinomycetes bacterium]